MFGIFCNNKLVKKSIRLVKMSRYFVKISEFLVKNQEFFVKNLRFFGKIFNIFGKRNKYDVLFLYYFTQCKNKLFHKFYFICLI